MLKLKTFEGSPEYDNISADISWINQRIQITPARFPHETVPATYREVTEIITTLRPRTEIIGKAATYKTINKPITTQEAYSDWKTGCVSTDPMQCIIDIPAAQTILQQQFIDFPARMIQVEKPTKTIKIKRKVLLSPGQGHGTPIPAEYKDIKVGRINKVWQVIAKPRPDRFAHIPVKVKTRSERIRSTPTLCYEQAQPKYLRKIQQQLQQRGYSVTPHGKPDQQTLQAVIQFQQDNDLSIGAITLETLRKLALH